VPHPNLAMVRHVRHAAERALPCSFCDSISIYTSPVYIVTYDVIFWSVNLRNNISDKVNVGIFSCDAVFFYSEKRVTRWLLWHSDFTKFNYRWGSLRRSPSSRLGRGTPSPPLWTPSVFIAEQNLVGISAVMDVLFYRCLIIHIMRHRTVI